MGITALSLVIACSTDADEDGAVAGEDFTGTNIRVISIDTFDVQLSTMKFDSIVTSTSERLLIGKYQDNDMGTVNASTYLQITPSSYSLDNDAILDSIGLVLGYDTYYYNDTTQVSNINVYKLSDRMTSDDDDDYYYNTTETAYEATPLVSKSYYPTPNKDSLYVTLPYDFGEDLFNEIRDNNITDSESLYQKLKGITIQPGDSDNSSVIGFSTTSDVTYIRFYYTIPDELETDEYTYDMTINSYYNYIDSDVSGLPLEAITDQEYNLVSTESNNISYNQAGVGYVTRIEFPSIKDIYNIGNEGTVLDAVLYIEPNSSSHSDIQPLNDALLLYTIDQNNDLASQISNSVDVVTAAINNDNSEFNEIVYTVPVIDFIDYKLSESPETEDALILIPSDYNSTVNKMIFNDSQKSDFKTKLIVTYAVYE